MASIEDRLVDVRRRIAGAARLCGRDPADINLLVVSKTRPIDDIRAALAAGQCHFGENYLQEAVPKIDALADEPICWHFIGPIQANKTRAIANNFDWVHSVDRLKIAERLNAQRDPARPPLNICLQLNISGEASKSGLAPADLGAMAAAVAKLDRLRFRGLMCIPRENTDASAQFARLRRLLDELKQSMGARAESLDTLSMGMSGDLEAAIVEGATWLRIGTAVFGPRQSSIELNHLPGNG